MEFNFDAMMSQASQVTAQVEESESRKGGFKYPLIYTGVGTITFRLLFNPKSQSVSRLLRRHTIGTSKVPCLRTYGMECPICKAIDNVKNATGVDLSKQRSISKGISLAQFHSSTFEVGSKDNPINPKDVFLLMYPWSVYTEINKFINMVSKNPSALAEIFSGNTGPTFEIEHDSDNKYSFRSNAYNQINSANSEEEFSQLLEGLDDLNEVILPSTATPEVLSQVNKVAQEIEQEYLRISTPSYPSSSAPQMPTNAGMMAQQYSGAVPPQYDSSQIPPQQIPQNYPQYNAPYEPPQIPPQYANQYDSSQVPPMNPNPPMNNPNVPQVNPNPPMNSPSTSQMNPQQAQQNSNPACYGKYNKDDFTCAVCPCSIQCSLVNQ